VTVLFGYCGRLKLKTHIVLLRLQNIDVSSIHACIMPDSFQDIEFRRVRGQIVDCDVSAMGRKPIPYLPVLVVGSIVLNQIDFLGK